jgi:hypothetical protein
VEAPGCQLGDKTSSQETVRRGRSGGENCGRKPLKYSKHETLNLALSMTCRGLAKYLKERTLSCLVLVPYAISAKYSKQKTLSIIL